MAAGLLAVNAQPASAHAELTSTEPIGGTADSAPVKVMLHFTEAIDVAADSIRVFDASSRRVPTEHPTHPDGDRRSVAADLPDLDRGGYVVALAHATFAGATTVPANSDQTLTINAEEERGKDVHNAKVIIEVPGGFTVRSCQQKPGWSCSTSVASGNRTLVTWARQSGADPDARFTFAVRTPGRAGDYPFEVNQFYDDGKASRWDGPPDSDTPAPVLTVT
ncbi:MAG: copper resistance protein CopC [Acidimicrobiia bacterium]